jgi:deoxycytidylate deaminase
MKPDTWTQTLKPTIIDSFKFSDQIEILKKLASKSNMAYKHAACLLKSDKLYTLGINKKLRSHFRTKLDSKPSVALISIHAELDCISNCNPKVCKGMDILVIRVNKSNKLLNSRPCNSCIEKLQKRGIRKVYYSDNDGNILSEYVNTMPKLHTCSGVKFKNC